MHLRTPAGVHEVRERALALRLPSFTSVRPMHLRGEAFLTA
ncbi:MAG TPA: hypothetical protein VGC57_07210 [Cellulomonas sp.]